VRYQGETGGRWWCYSPQIADDASELVQVEYEYQEAVTDGEEALRDALCFTKMRNESGGGAEFSIR